MMGMKWGYGVRTKRACNDKGGNRGLLERAAGWIAEAGMEMDWAATAGLRQGSESPR